MKNKRKRRSRLAKVKLVPVETPTEQRKKFPDKLIKAFVSVVLYNWENDKAYKKYTKEVKKYLCDQADDRIENGKLIVQLTKATMDLVNEKKKKI